MRTINKLALLITFVLFARYSHAQTIDSALTEVKQDGIWQNQGLTVFYYDGFCRNTRMINFYWDAFAQQWVNSYRSNTTYDANGNQTELFFQYWDGANWINNFRQMTTYSDVSKSSETKVEYWDPANNKWIKNFKRLDSLDSEGHNVYSLVQSNVNDEWTNSSRDLYRYGADDRLDVLRQDSWITEDWIRSNKTELIFSDDYIHEKDLNYYWNATTAEWLFSGRNIYNFIPGTRLVTSFLLQSSYNNEPVNFLRDSIRYDNDNRMSSSLVQLWDANLNAWTQLNKTRWDYYPDGSIHHNFSTNTNSGITTINRTTYTHNGCAIHLQRSTTTKELSTFKNSKSKNVPATITATNGSIVMQAPAGISINNKAVVYKTILTATIAAPVLNSAGTITKRASGFSVMPNPAKDYIIVNLQKSGQNIIRLTDLSGKTLLTKTIQGAGAQKINLPAMAPGTYIVTVTTGNTLESKLVQVQ